MKRLLIAGLLLALALGCVLAQEPVYYNTTPTVVWTPAATAPDGSAFLAGDTVEYRVYAWDAATGLVTPDVVQMSLMATWVDTDPFAATLVDTGEESLQVTFETRIEWFVALAATHIDGGGNRTDYPALLYSSVAGDTASGVPFSYVPSSEAPLAGTGPTGLRDSGM